MSLEISDIVTPLLDKKNTDYINLSDLKKGKIASQLSKILGINIKKHSNGELMNIIKSLLPSEYYFKKKGRSLYLLKKPSSEIVYFYAKKHPTLTPNSICSKLPFSREEFAYSVNTLLKEGSIEISIISQSKGFGFKITPIDRENKDNKKDELRRAYLRLLKGKSHVEIFELRRYLNWSREQFDFTIQKLWEGGVVELQESNPALLSDEEKKDSYRDKNNGLRILLVWRR